MAKVTQPTVTLKNIAAEIAESQELSKKQMNAIMEEIVGHLVKNLKKGNRVRLAGLGILQVRKRAAFHTADIARRVQMEQIGATTGAKINRARLLGLFHWLAILGHINDLRHC